jgi:hypothetical protein
MSRFDQVDEGDLERELADRSFEDGLRQKKLLARHEARLARAATKFIGELNELSRMGLRPAYKIEFIETKDKAATIKGTFALTSVSLTQAQKGPQ